MSEIDKIRILHIITGTGSGGAETMLRKLLSSVDRVRFDARVVCLARKGSVGDALEKSGYAVRYLNSGRHIWFSAVFPQLIKEIRFFQPHVIQGWMYHGNIAAAAAAFCARSPASVVWNIRHSLENLNNEKFLTEAIIRRSAYFSRWATRVIYNSASSALQHQAIGYSRDNALTIPNGFKVDDFRRSEQMRAEARARLGIDPDRLVVALIARYHPIKAHAVFLKAAAICARRLPNVRFLLAGHGVVESNAELVERVRELDLRERVMLLGELEDVTSIYPALDLLVLSSHSEAFPNVLGEAMASGVPCACTDVGDCARIVGETGRVVSPGRSDLLAGVMVDLLEEPESRG